MKFGSDTSFMTPVIHLTSVPYAYYSDNAGALGGVAAANFVQLATGTVQADSSTNDSISINKSGASGNIITLQSGGTPVFVIGNTGALTLTPKGNNVGTIVRQTSGTATSGNIFDIQGANGTSHFIQVAETAANAGSISITSLGSNAVTIDSGSGTVVYGSTTTTIQKSGSAFTVDVSNGASDSTLTIANSGGAGNIQLKLDTGGTFAVGSAVGQSTSCGASQALTNSTYTGGILTTAGTCSSVGGGGTFASTYSATSQANNTIAYSNSGGGALIIQNASTPLSTVLSIDTVSSTFHYLQLNLASSIPHLQVFGASSSEYADVYYDASAHTAFFKASGSNTTQVGTGSGPVNITAGASSAVAITGHANSTFATDSGYVRLDGPSGIQLGVPSSSSGNLIFNYGSGAATAAITFAGNATSNSVYTLPSTAVSSSQCLQSGTVSGTSVPLTFGSCGSGGGDSITVNSTAATDANFLDVAATGTVAGTTWTLNTATNPDNITLAISTASASVAGIVNNTTQTFAGAKTFQSNSASGFIVQDSANSKNILSVDTSGDQVVLGVAGTSGVNGKIVFNTTNASNASVTLVSQSTATSYSIVLPSATAGGTNYCLVGTNASGTTTTSWVPCGSGSTGKITLTPEYPGAVMTADGSGNTGTMTSDFCSGSSLRNIPSTSNPCGASEEHNFYTWVTTSQNDYDIWIRWQVPSDFSDFAASNAIQMYGWRTDNTATTSVTLSAYNSSGAQCGTSTNVATGTATWTQTSMGGTVTAAGCTISAGNVIDLRIQMAANNKTVRAGEITINYQRN
jgi:hypothetical protein